MQVLRRLTGLLESPNIAPVTIRIAQSAVQWKTLDAHSNSHARYDADCL